MTERQARIAELVNKLAHALIEDVYEEACKAIVSGVDNVMTGDELTERFVKLHKEEVEELDRLTKEENQFNQAVVRFLEH